MFLLLLLDADCSGRTLATLLVAWVATAMVASVLLRWEYMWIVLVSLTVLFLLVCGYIAYHTKKAHSRALRGERIRGTNSRQRRERQIWTISGATGGDNRGEAESPAYLITDLPPSYASVVLQQETETHPRVSLNTVEPSNDVKYEEPPPYSAVILSAETLDRNRELSYEPNTLSPTPMVRKDNSASGSPSARRMTN